MSLIAGCRVNTRDPRRNAVSDIAQLNLSLLMYTQDNMGFFPDMRNEAGLKRALGDYAKDEKLFVDPVTHLDFQANPMLSNKKLSSIADQGQTVTFYQPRAADDGTRCVGFLAGPAQVMTDAAWRQCAANNGISGQ